MSEFLITATFEEGAMPACCPAPQATLIECIKAGERESFATIEDYYNLHRGDGSVTVVSEYKSLHLDVSDESVPGGNFDLAAHLLPAVQRDLATLEGHIKDFSNRLPMRTFGPLINSAATMIDKCPQTGPLMLRGARRIIERIQLIDEKASSSLERHGANPFTNRMRARDLDSRFVATLVELAG